MLCVARSVIQLYGMLIIIICGNKVLKKMMLQRALKPTDKLIIYPRHWRLRTIIYMIDPLDETSRCY